jgi:hypothetical protein
VIADPGINTIARPYRGLSVQDVDVPLTPRPIEALLRSRKVYRRTAFLALRSDRDTALVAIRPSDPDQLFSPVAELRVLSGPVTTVWIDEPTAEVSNASSLAATALAHRQDDTLVYLVRGRFEHVNFIWRPTPIPIRVTEVVPPFPPKLYAMAEQVIGYDEDLPPVHLLLDAVDLGQLMMANPARHHLLPCRGSGAGAGETVSFLDCHPAYDPEWLLIGCERSRQFHEHFYGTQPRQVDLCPRIRAPGHPRSSGDRVLTKCCLLERGVQVEGSTAVVPWGASLDEVRSALRALCGIRAADPPAIVAAPPHSTVVSRRVLP